MAAALAVLDLTDGGIRALQASTTGPVDPVEGLLTLINANEGNQTADLFEVDSPLATDQALEQGYTPPEQTRTTNVIYGQADADAQRPSKNTTVVGVSYLLGEETHTAQVRVQREPARWVRSWEPADQGDQVMDALALTSAHLEHALFTDTVVKTAPSGSTPISVTALPGTYQLSVGDDDPLFDAADLDTIAVGGAGSIHRTEVTIPGPDLAFARDYLRKWKPRWTLIRRSALRPPPSLPPGSRSAWTRRSFVPPTMWSGPWTPHPYHHHRGRGRHPARRAPC